MSPLVLTKDPLEPGNFGRFFQGCTRNRQNQFELRSYSSWDYTKSVLAIFVGMLSGVFLNTRRWTPGKKDTSNDENKNRYIRRNLGCLRKNILSGVIHLGFPGNS